MALARPNTIHYAFAVSASGPYINTIPDSPTGSFTASWQQGFPPVTMTLPGAGGQNPAGQDFNGVLFAISANVQWTLAGGQPAYDAGLSTAAGGYAVGAVLMLNDNASLVVNTTNGNTNNPNSTFTGWAPFGGALSTAGNFGTESGSGNAYVVALTPPITAYKNGLLVRFKATHSNTASATLDAGGGAVALVRLDGSALNGGDVLSGSVYSAIYDSAASRFVLLSPAVTQYAGRASSEFTTLGGFNTTSTTAVYSGYSGTITPSSSGTVLVNVSGSAQTQSGSSTSFITIIYGTGTPPTAGTSATGGTVAGRNFRIFASAPAEIMPWSRTARLTGLALGVPVWVAVAVTSGVGATTYILDVVVDLTEL